MLDKLLKENDIYVLTSSDNDVDGTDFKILKGTPLLFKERQNGYLIFEDAYGHIVKVFGNTSTVKLMEERLPNWYEQHLTKLFEKGSDPDKDWAIWWNLFILYFYIMAPLLLLIFLPCYLNPVYQITAAFTVEILILFALFLRKLKKCVNKELLYICQQSYKDQLMFELAQLLDVKYQR